MQSEGKYVVLVVGYLIRLAITLGIGGLIALIIWLVWGSISPTGAILSGVVAYLLTKGWWDAFEEDIRKEFSD